MKKRTIALFCTGIIVFCLCMYLYFLSKPYYVFPSNVGIEIDAVRTPTENIVLQEEQRQGLLQALRTVQVVRSIHEPSRWRADDNTLYIDLLVLDKDGSATPYYIVHMADEHTFIYSSSASLVKLRVPKNELLNTWMEQNAFPFR